ncbi:hypothetical protein PHMEG_00027425 [Phytophthora megakarya]|uniref:Uncharacterized protein n=1 Tax=Phytophthora megakarya TaxID=4795 RepID=A0A225V9W3_9STRA|nr:hypothetical protein PHMEG_00027425 [Phytophthora megakarya]
MDPDKLNKSNSKFDLSDEQLRNVKDRKRRLCSPSVLHVPDFTKHMHPRTDAGKFALPIVKTDHKSIETIVTQKMTNSRPG